MDRHELLEFDGENNPRGFGRISFFSDQHLALPTIAAVNIWRHMGLVALLFYAGMQGIPRDIYEAARIEGAGPWRSFWNITLPLLMPGPKESSDRLVCRQ